MILLDGRKIPRGRFSREEKPQLGKHYRDSALYLAERLEDSRIVRVCVPGLVLLWWLIASDPISEFSVAFLALFVVLAGAMGLIASDPFSR
jgi:hypothetical protein